MVLGVATPIESPLDLGVVPTGGIKRIPFRASAGSFVSVKVHTCLALI